MEIIDDGKVTIDIDWVIANYSREELLSALGFDTPTDFLSEVTVSDTIEHFGESTIADNIDINEYWDSETAYNRYGTELLDYFDTYYNLDGWGACDHIEYYGDYDYMLEALLKHFLSVKRIGDVLKYTLSEEDLLELQEKLGVAPKVKHDILEALLKANYEAQKEVHEKISNEM